MTPDEIRAAVSADPALQALAATGDTQAIADALSVGRTRVQPRLVTARGMAELIGPIESETILLKLEGASAAMLVSSDPTQMVVGSLLRRQLSFLAGAEGLDFGSAVLRQMLDQFVALGILTAPDVALLKTIGVEPDPVTQRDVQAAIINDDGTLKDL